MNKIDKQSEEKQLLELERAIKTDIIKSENDLLDVYFLFGCEIEFYIKHETKLSLQSPIVLSVIEELNDFARQTGVEIIDLTEEDGFNQFEIAIKPTDQIENISNFITTIQHYANNLNIVLDAKPYPQEAGSAIHFHISIYNEEDINILASIKHNEKYSRIMNHIIGGLLFTMPKFMSIFAPTDSCYKRFIIPKNVDDHIHYPTNYSWGENNRTCAIRIPQSSTKSKSDTRIEHRVSSPVINTYRAISAILEGIRYGIIHKMNSPEQIFGNAFDSQYDYLTRLPINLNEAKQKNNILR